MADEHKSIGASDQSEPPVEGQRPHPIAEAINSFLHNMRDIESLARIYVPLSQERRKKRFRQLSRAMEKHVKLVKDSDSPPTAAQMTRIFDALLTFDRLRQSNAPRMLELSLFLGMFSGYDVFTGNLLTAIYSKKPELFNQVQRSIGVAEILQFDSFDTLKESILQTEIELFRRKSYVEQFQDLETTFGLELKAFSKWPLFVECGQRRNLLTHCGGVVTEQYLAVCSREGYSFVGKPELGEKLKLGKEYFLSSCELLMEVGFKLGQTLWRKIFPKELDEADSHLSNVIYRDCLRMEKWDRAVTFGEFAVGQKKLASDMNRKVCTINYAIGLKFSGQESKAIDVLNNIDWSGAALDFQLAVVVLKDEYNEASEIMKRIGHRGAMLSEHAYHDWPLFHDFRKSPQFLQTYEEIFGYPFIAELERTINRAQAATDAEIEKKNLEQSSSGTSETAASAADGETQDELGTSEHNSGLER